MHQVMRYCVDTLNQGLLLKPFGVWKNDEELIVMGMSDVMYASDLDTQQSIMGWTTFLNGALVIMKSNM